jgi:hypothetical protein
MLALARYFAGRPRRRDLYFVMATGHFQLPQFIRKISDRFVIGNDASRRRFSSARAHRFTLVG